MLEFIIFIVVYVTCGSLRGTIDVWHCSDFMPRTNLQFCYFKNLTGLVPVLKDGIQVNRTAML